MAWFNNTDGSKRFALGTRKKTDTKEFVYLQGVASCEDNDTVTYQDNDFIAVRSLGNAVGKVAVAQAAITASLYGWFQIYGPSTVQTDASVAADVQMFLTSTAGDLDDADVAGDTIIGMYSTAADNSSALTTAVTLNYPHVADKDIDA
jgi:hypothetical protein